MKKSTFSVYVLFAFALALSMELGCDWTNFLVLFFGFPLTIIGAHYFEEEYEYDGDNKFLKWFFC